MSETCPKCGASMTIYDTPGSYETPVAEHVVDGLDCRLRSCEAQLAAQAKEIKKLRRRLAAMMPLFQEARDALPAISMASARLHNLDLGLADRMDDVGIKERWEAAEAAKEQMR